MTGSLGRRYARAILSLAREENRLDEVGAELHASALAFGDPQLEAVVLNPAVPASERAALVARILDALGTSKIVTNLVRLLASRDRLVFIGDVHRAYDALVDRELGRVRVVIRSAVELEKADESQLVDLARSLAGKDVLVSTEVDANLIGGVTLDVGGVVYDGSVRTRLERMTKAMALDE